MKTFIFILLTGLLIFSAVTGYAQSSAGLIDERFAKVNQWLHQENLSITKNVNQAFVDNHIVVEGEGLPSKDATTPGQKRLTALRAAEVIAYRRLSEFLDGVAIAGDSTTKELSLKYDIVRIAVTGFVKGAQFIYREYNEKEETALVLLKVGMTGPSSYGEVIYSKVMKDAKVGEALADKDKQAFTPKPVPVDVNYDSLIIDATGHNFRPALINRVYTEKDEVLYDPSKVSQKILVEHGCGEYTNTVAKARAALESRGAKNPLIIKAAGTKNPSDLQVSNDDAVQIFSSNQKSNFLGDAKVAFVLR